MKKLVNIFCVIWVTTLLLCCAYYLGTTQTVRSEIPERYINTYSKDFAEQYIDTDSIKSVIATKDGFEIYTNDGNVFFFDCVK